MYEYFEHTADIGFRIVAPELNSLYEEAAQALFALIVSDPKSIQPRSDFDLEIEATDRELLLRDWLDELLVLWDSRQTLID